MFNTNSLVNVDSSNGDGSFFTNNKIPTGPHTLPPTGSNIQSAAGIYPSCKQTGGKINRTKINKISHPNRIGECRQLKNPTSWEISFDTREKWNVGGWRKILGIGYDLRSTALHEFGHIIDLPHADRFDFIMHADYNEQIKLLKEESKQYRDYYIAMNDK
jgi:hypothetical protein